MKHADRLHAKSQSDNVIWKKQIKDSLTEHEILSLQDAFLVNGLHTLHFSNQALGRTLIHDFLQSLPMYNNIACLTLENNHLLTGIFDIHSTLFNEGINEQSIEEFFINEFYFDFMWIEVSDSLSKAPWYGHFCKIMQAYKQQMPILLVYYT